MQDKHKQPAKGRDSHRKKEMQQTRKRRWNRCQLQLQKGSQKNPQGATKETSGMHPTSHELHPPKLTDAVEGSRSIGTRGGQRQKILRYDKRHGNESTGAVGQNTQKGVSTRSRDKADVRLSSTSQ